MSLLSGDYYCRRFQPNPFDPSRCGSCLRPDHMHLNSGAVAQQDLDEDDVSSEATTCQSSDVLSTGWVYEWTLAHSLSPDWELNLCDTDTQSSSPDQRDCPGRPDSLSPERHCVARKDMTRQDPSSHRGSYSSGMDDRRGRDSSGMDDRRGRDRSRRPSESREERGQESGYFSPDRREEGGRQPEEVNKRPYRYYERGRPLPSNHSPEAKACVPFRTVNLGIPSQRRSTDTFIQESWRSESPQRYTYHSNFRRTTESQENSPSRHCSVSPDRYKLSDPPLGSQRRTSQSRSRNASDAPSRVPSQVPSHNPSRHTSGRSSPSRRRGSVVSRPVSPPRASPSRKRGDSSHLQNGEHAEYAERGRSRESRRPSQASVNHSLDSERLCRNLESISRCGSSGVPPHTFEASQASPRTRTAGNSSANTRARNSREASPPRSGRSTDSHSPYREPHSRDSRPDTTQTYSLRAHERQDKSNSSPPPLGSWRGSAHSLLSPDPSQGSSPSRQGLDSQLLAHSLKSHAEVMETHKGDKARPTGSRDRSRSTARRGLEALLTSEPKKPPAEVEEVGMTIDDYIVLADIPVIHLESEEELPQLRKRNQSISPRRDQRFRAPSSQDQIDAYSSRVELDERGRGRERGRDRREKCRDSDEGGVSRQQSSTSIRTEGSDPYSEKHRSSKTKERVPPEHNQTQWRKHWFVLADSSLKYYRDSDAEESDDLDGEIDLTSCVNVSDCDVERNYGFQIHTKRTVFTLSATTSRIRRNWTKMLSQAIQDYTTQSDSGSEKEKPLSRRPSSCQPSARHTCKESGYETTTSAANSSSFATLNSQHDYHQANSVDLDPQATPTNLSPASPREAGEGWDREQAKRLEERNKWFEKGIPFSEMGSRWDSMELKRGSVPVPLHASDAEVNRKWAELERMSFREMTAQSIMGAQTQSGTSEHQEAYRSRVSSLTCQSIPEEALTPVTHSQTDETASRNDLPSMNGTHTIQSNMAEALQREALSLRHQVESIKRERVAMGMEAERGACGPGAPCRATLEALEASHQRVLQELQEKHAAEVRQLQRERDRLLEDKSQAAAKAIEALQQAHKEELEREVEKARRLLGGGPHVEPQHRGQTELDALSERHSQKCLELSRAEQGGRGQEAEAGRKERELEQLRRENKDLKARLAEEISRMRCIITGQSPGVVSPGNASRSPPDIEMLLRAKENEVEYLHKEISCLQSEVQALTKEKEAAYERYKEAYVELSDTKGRSQLEIGSLKEHLRLVNAVQQEAVRNT